MLEPKTLESVIGTALLYPCCGDDLEIPIRLFGAYVSQFFFVDIRRPRLPKDLGTIAAQVGRPISPGIATFRNLETDNRYQINRWTRRGEDAFAEIPNLGIFFHRGDTLADGEGSSGIPWLGRQWLNRILDKLVPGGLIVTDGSNCPPDGPPELRKFYRNWKMGSDAVSMLKQFDFEGREFACIGYAGDRYGPTLIWKVS